jgi:hypothetical protein
MLRIDPLYHETGYPVNYSKDNLDFKRRLQSKEPDG